MFAKTIIDSDAFLEMPMSARLLYYDLGMRADDDGFINSPKKIARITGSSDDDFKILFAKKFIIPFDSGVVVIKHWRINNYIQKDRYHETKYTDEKATLQVEKNGAYKFPLKAENAPCIQDVSRMDTQSSLGKASLGNIIESSYEDSCPGKIPDENPKPKKERARPVYEHSSAPY